MALINRAKYYYFKLNLNNGWDEHVIKSLLNDKFTEEKLDFFRRFYGCLLGKKFCNKMTEAYLTTENLSMRETIANYNELHPEERINENTALSQMNYCSGKLKAIFTDDKMLENIYNAEGAINEKYLKQLNKFIIMYGSKSESKKDFNINIPAFKRSGEVTDESFVNFLRLLQPYTKNYMRNVQADINSRVNEIGYFNYIMKPDIELTPTEQKHKEFVEIILGQREGELPTSGVVQAPEMNFSKSDLVKDKHESEIDSVNSKDGSKDVIVPDFSNNDEDELIDLTSEKNLDKQESNVEILGNGYVRIYDKYGIPRLIQEDKYFSKAGDQ